MKFLTVLCLLLSYLNFTHSYDGIWTAYKAKYQKLYNRKHEGDKRKIWEKNADMVAKHNLEADVGLHTFRLELNRFSDMTDSQLDVYRKCFKPGNISQVISTKYFKCGRTCLASLPESVDWREKNLVTPIKNQGECGSCWAFSSTGALEGQNKARWGTLVPLSEQNLIDCSRKEGNNGCNGGWMDYGFQYVIENGGIDSEQSYSYEAKEGECRFVQWGASANCTKYVRIPQGSEKLLQAAVANIGPISVAIDAFSLKFLHYKEGVYYDESCTTDLDHAVLVVGYGTLNGSDYWIVKNSWGTSWGMDGYILMARNAGNMCGIASHAVYPIV